MKIGEGGFGIVRNIGDGWVVKTVRSSSYNICGDGIPHSFIRECNVLSICDHPNIMSVADITMDNNLAKFAIKIPLGDSDLLKAKNVDIISVLKDIASGLYYLEQNNIIHGDLKPENIIMFDGKAVIADFGLVKFESNLIPFDEELTTMCWKSPEELVFEIKGGDVIRDHKSTSWSFGMLIYYLFHGKSAVEHISSSVYDKFCHLLKNLNTDTKFSDIFEPVTEHWILSRLLTVPDKNLVGLMGRCLIFDPCKRITMYEICRELNLFVDKPLSPLDKLLHNTVNIIQPPNFDEFLSALKYVVSAGGIYSSDYIPLAINIYCRIANKIFDVNIHHLAIACMTLSSKLKNGYFNRNGCLNVKISNSELINIERLILHTCEYKIWTTTALSYLEILLPIEKHKLHRKYKLQLSNKLLEGVWMDPLDLANLVINSD